MYALFGLFKKWAVLRISPELIQTIYFADFFNMTPNKSFYSDQNWPEVIHCCYVGYCVLYNCKKLHKIT